MLYTHKCGSVEGSMENYSKENDNENGLPLKRESVSGVINAGVLFFLVGDTVCCRGLTFTNYARQHDHRGDIRQHE